MRNSRSGFGSGFWKLGSPVAECKQLGRAWLLYHDIAGKYDMVRKPVRKKRGE